MAINLEAAPSLSIAQAPISFGEGFKGLSSAKTPSSVNFSNSIGQRPTLMSMFGPAIEAPSPNASLGGDFRIPKAEVLGAKVVVKINPVVGQSAPITEFAPRANSLPALDPISRIRFRSISAGFGILPASGQISFTESVHRIGHAHLQATAVQRIEAQIQKAEAAVANLTQTQPVTQFIEQVKPAVATQSGVETLALPAVQTLPQISSKPEQRMAVSTQDAEQVVVEEEVVEAEQAKKWMFIEAVPEMIKRLEYAKAAIEKQRSQVKSGLKVGIELNQVNIPHVLDTKSPIVRDDENKTDYSIYDANAAIFKHGVVDSEKRALEVVFNEVIKRPAVNIGERGKEVGKGAYFRVIHGEQRTLMESPFITRRIKSMVEEQLPSSGAEEQLKAASRSPEGSVQDITKKKSGNVMSETVTKKSPQIEIFEARLRALRKARAMIVRTEVLEKPKGPSQPLDLKPAFSLF